MRFETFVSEEFLNGEHVVIIFFDLEKAYDTTGKYGIMKDLHDMDLRGRLPLFIQNFLSERKSRVRVGTSLSDFCDQEMGVPRGAFYLSSFLLSKSTASPVVLEMVLTSLCLLMTLVSHIDQNICTL